MAESTLTLLWADLMNSIAEFLRYGRESDPSTPAVWTTGQEAQIKRILDQGYRQMMFPPIIGDKGIEAHSWSFLHPVTSLKAWPTTTGQVNGTPSYVSPSSTVNSLIANFYPSMVGQTFTFDQTPGAMTGAPSYDGSAYSTVTVSTAICNANMVGRDLTFTTSGTKYEIVSYVDTTHIKLQGNAASEKSGDTFTIETGNEYPIATYVSATQITITGDASGETADSEFTITGGSYRLPDDFGGIESWFTFAKGEGWYAPIEQMNEAQVRAAQQRSDASGRPTAAALVAVAHDGSSGPRFDLLLTPIPDAVYPLYYQYTALADQLTSTANYPLGGMPYSNCMLASCLASAELVRDGAHGPYWDDFLSNLRTCISDDERKFSGQTVGKVIDPNFDWQTGTSPLRKVVDGSGHITYQGVNLT